MNKLIFSLCVFASLSVYCATPLEHAAATGNIDKVKSLLSQLADINETDEDSTWEKTAIFAAAEAGNHKVVVYLLANDADTKLANAAGATPLRVAAYKGHADVVRSLLEGGTNPEQDTDYYQRSPFVWAVLGARSAKDGNTANYVSVLKTLREHGANCPTTFIHPVNDSTVKVADSAKKSGQEKANIFAKLCGGTMKN